MSVLGPFEDAVASLEAGVRDLDPECLEADAALRALSLLSRAAKLAEAGRTVLARRVEECGLHRRSGHLSAAHLLAATAGSSIGEAAETIATGLRLRDQGEVDDAFRAGELSFEQAAAVSRAVAADPAAVRPMLDLARRETLGTVRARAREVAAAAEADRVGRYERQCAAAALRHGVDECDGMVWAHFRLPPDSGAVVVTRLEAETDRVWREARAEGRHASRERCAAEALVRIVTGPAGGNGAGRGRG